MIVRKWWNDGILEKWIDGKKSQKPYAVPTSIRLPDKSKKKAYYTGTERDSKGNTREGQRKISAAVKRRRTMATAEFR